MTTDHAKRQQVIHESLMLDGHHVAIVDSLAGAVEAVREWGLTPGVRGRERAA